MPMKNVSYKQVMQLVDALKTMDAFEDNIDDKTGKKELDKDLAKLLKEFKRAESAGGLGEGLSDFEADGEDRQAYRERGDPMDYFDESDFEVERSDE